MSIENITLSYNNNIIYLRWHKSWDGKIELEL